MDLLHKAVKIASRALTDRIERGECEDWWEGEMQRLRTEALWAVSAGILWMGFNAVEAMNACIVAKGAGTACRRAGENQEFLSLLVVVCAICVPLAYLYVTKRFGD
ncbi:hypothetical protein ACFZ8E_26675 [Methylobacterium sp. HMF5984]|uniref:hypothetical protein n=1 Tax=Methylobacterium sp. HMF5984 TaxID=3367370 RepID=UPI0038527E94